MNNVRIEKSIELSDWIGSSYESLDFVCDGRVEFSLVCYYITWQHHAAIAQLCRVGLFAPATALIRCAWDSYTRGMWLHLAATPEQLEKFKQKGEVLKDKDILLSIQTAISETENGLLKARETKYSRLCDFTHTGIGQFSNHFVAGEITASLDDSAVDEVLCFVEGLALGALSHMALIGHSQEIAAQALNRMRELKP